MAAITIITPVGRRSDVSRGYLHRAAVSVADLALVLAHTASRHTVEWLISPDGEVTSDLGEALTSCPSTETLTVRVLPAVEEKLGPAVARNRALREAQGSMVLALDADDFLEPAAVAAMVETLEIEGTLDEVGYVAGLTLEVDGTGKPLILPGTTLPQGFIPRDIYTHYALKHEFWPWHPSATLMKTQAVRAVGGWATEQPYWARGEDTALLARLSHLAPGFWYPEIVHHYRINPEGLTANFSGDIRRDGQVRMALLAEECGVHHRVNSSPVS